MLPNHNDNDSNVMPQGADGLVDPQRRQMTQQTPHTAGVEEAAQSVNGALRGNDVGNAVHAAGYVHGSADDAEIGGARPA